MSYISMLFSWMWRQMEAWDSGLRLFFRWEKTHGIVELSRATGCYWSTYGVSSQQLCSCLCRRYLCGWCAWNAWNDESNQKEGNAQEPPCRGPSLGALQGRGIEMISCPCLHTILVPKNVRFWALNFQHRPMFQSAWYPSLISWRPWAEEALQAMARRKQLRMLQRPRMVCGMRYAMKMVTCPSLLEVLESKCSCDF